MTTEPFADQHAIIEAAQNRICEAEESIYAALARIPKPRASPPPAATNGDTASWPARTRVISRWATGS